MARAQTKLQLASQAPELHNMHEVYHDMYEALGVSDVDRIMKSVPSEDPVPLDPAQENINALNMLNLTAFEGQNHQAHIQAHLIFGSSQMVAGLPPVAMSLQKHVMEHVQIAAQEQAMQQMAQQGMQMQGPEQEIQFQAAVAQFVAEGLQQVKDLSGQLSGAGAPDPLVELKKAELEQDAQQAAADDQLDQQKLQLDAQNQQMRSDQFQQRLASQERQTQARIQSAMQREMMKQRGNQQ